MRTLTISGGSHKGCKRESNQDCFLLAGIIQRDGIACAQISLDSFTMSRYGLLCAVADGMGGHNGGEFASQFVLERLAAEFSRAPSAAHSGEVENFFKEILLQLHASLNEQTELHPELLGMGTTLTGVFYFPPSLLLFHAGDSRLYRFREGHLMQLSRDHSLEAATGAAPSSSRRTSVITNCIGGGHDAACHPDVEAGVSFNEGDILMLCSDGLWDSVEQKSMEDILKMDVPSYQRVQQLIDASLQKGAPDNVTVVLMHKKEGFLRGG